MESFLISPLFAFLGILLSILVGYILSKMLGSKNSIDYEAQNKALQASLEKANKSERILQKQVGRHNTELEKAQSNYDELAAKYKPQTNQLKNTEEKLKELHKELDKLKLDLDRNSNKYDITAKRLEEAQAKLSGEKKETKAWQKEISQLNKTIEDGESKYRRLLTKEAELIAQLKDYESMKEEILPLRRSLKAHQKDIKRLNEDVSYWEKKHYDTHHELATIKKEIPTHIAQIKSLTDQINGHKIQEENMKKMISEYKGNLITANEKYYKLSKQVEN